jgi:hypothetical protein
MGPPGKIPQVNSTSPGTFSGRAAFILSMDKKGQNIESDYTINRENSYRFNWGKNEFISRRKSELIKIPVDWPTDS